MRKNPLIIISGATATGKTATAIRLAQDLNKQNLNTVIINFDSLLFYQELNIGTAKPRPEELKLVPHFLINIQSAKSPLNASDYIEKAEILIHECHQKNQVPILVGGSAFYLRALIKGMYDSPKTDDGIKHEVETMFKKDGINSILDYLKVHDPDILHFLHINDHYRLMRAVEHHKSTGTKISEQKKVSDQADPYDFSKCRFNWNLLHLYLDLPKDFHLKIIEKRTHQMLEDGLIDEVKSLLELGFTGKEKPLESIGYLETQAYLRGELKTLEELAERISISTRQLAKSQRTFFKKITPKNCYHPVSDYEKILDQTLHFLKD